MRMLDAVVGKLQSMGVPRVNSKNCLTEPEFAVLTRQMVGEMLKQARREEKLDMQEACHQLLDKLEGLKGTNARKRLKQARIERKRLSEMKVRLLKSLPKKRRDKIARTAVHAG